jgi:hypothetical protein
VLLARIQGRKSVSCEMDSRLKNKADIFTKNLDGPLFKSYAELLLGEGAISSKGGDTK